MFFESQVGTIGDRERRKRKSKDGKGQRLKFTEDRSKRQSGKTDEKPAKRREIDCSVFLELCIVLKDRKILHRTLKTAQEETKQRLV